LPRLEWALSLVFGMAADAGGVLVSRLIVESTDTTHSITPASALSVCRPVRIAAHRPASCQARNSP
jgi:hypothetical protein